MTKRPMPLSFVHDDVLNLNDKELFGNLTRDEWRAEVTKTIDAHLNAVTLDKRKLHTRMEQIEADNKGLKARLRALEARERFVEVTDDAE